MIELDFSGYPISPEQSRSARKQIGLTQAQASTESGLSAHTLKAFEKGNTYPPVAFLEALRDFYEGRGVTFPNTDLAGANAKADGLLFPSGVIGSDETLVGEFRPSVVLHVRLDSSIPTDEIGRIFDHIQHNEETVASLLRQKVDKAQVRGLSDASEAIHGRVVRLLAENGTLLSKLFGRPLVEPKHRGKIVINHADLLAKTQDDMLSAIDGDRKAQIRVREPQFSGSLKAAIFD